MKEVSGKYNILTKPMSLIACLAPRSLIIIGPMFVNYKNMNQALTTTSQIRDAEAMKGWFQYNGWKKEMV